MKGKNGKMKNHLGAEGAPALFGELSQMIQLTKKSCNSRNSQSYSCVNRGLNASQH